MGEPLRVLLSSVGGLADEGYARGYNFCRAFPTDGSVEVDVVTRSPPAADDLDHPYVTSVRAGGRNGLHRRAVQARIVRDRLRTREYDVFHRFNLYGGQFSPILQRGPPKTPTVVGPVEPPHGFGADEFHRNIVGNLLGLSLPRSVTYPAYRALKLPYYPVDALTERLFANTLRNADAVVLVDRAALDAHRRHLADRSTIRIVPQGVRHDRIPFSPAPDAAELLYVGRLSERKGVLDVLRAMPSVLEAAPDAHLHVVGRGELEDEVRRAVAALELGEAVTLHGRVSDEELAALRRRATLFVHPSTGEGYFHTRLEAMAAGCVVVGTALPGADEVTDDGVDGLLFPPGDREALADRVVALLADPDRCLSYAERARERVEREFDWGRIVERYVEIYRQIQ